MHSQKSSSRVVNGFRECVSSVVHDYLRERLAYLGQPSGTLDKSSDLVRARVLDSLALTGLIAAVERATSREIDFLEVDPEALGTVTEIVDELTRVLAAGERRS